MPSVTLSHMKTMERFISWNRRHVLPADTLVAVLIAALFVVLSGTTTNTPGLFAYYYSPVAQILWSCALIIPVAMRRWKPQLAALLFVGLVIVQLAVGPSLVYTDMLAPLMLYSVILYGDPRNSKAFSVMAFAVTLLAAAVITWTTTVGPYIPGVTAGFDPDAIIGSVGCSNTYLNGMSGDCATQIMLVTAATAAIIAALLACAVIMAYWQRARLATIRMLQERNDSIRAREEEERRIAALAERARIARDMHDVVAHTLSIIIIQSDGGRYAGAHDVDIARRTMTTIRHESERALHDMKRLLGVFGGSDHADYEDVDALVEQARAAAGPGCMVGRIVSGTPRTKALSPQASTAMYRVVQEALTNVRKYAGPNVAVRIDEQWTDDGLHVTVLDNGRGAGSVLDGHKPGYGLIGMRERIAAAGGTVEAGPQVGGGFVVSAFVPFTGTPAAGGPNAVPAAAAPPSASAPAWPAAPEHTTTDAMARSVQRPSADQPYESRPDRRGPDGRTQETTTENRPSPVPSDARMISPAVTISDFVYRYAPDRYRDRFRQMTRTLRSKPLRQAESAGGEPLNWVERLSRWTQRHYLLVDVIGTLLLLWVLVPWSGNGLYFGDTVHDLVSGLCSILAILPLMFRRRFPEATAATIAVLSALQLMFVPTVLVANIVAVSLAVYSAILYGRDHAWRWVAAAVAIDSALFGAQTFVENLGYSSIVLAMLRIGNGTVSGMSLGSAIFVALFFAGATMTWCAGMMALAQWHRSSGSNALVLQAREEALRAQQEKQKILAANMERDRISARIQTEVTQTLTGVIDKAVAGLRMLDDCASQGVEPSAEAIASAFADIGAQGREALAHMRQLLGVLRQTGFSDETGDTQPDMALRPARPLDDQLRAAAGQKG